MTGSGNGSPEEQLPAPALRVVLVDNREARRNLMRHVVEGGIRAASVVAEADSADAALLLVEQEGTDAVVVDIGMPLPEGLRTVGQLRRSFPRLGIVVCSFDLDRATVERALAEGADACLPKPANRHDLLAALEAACSAQASSAGMTSAGTRIG